MLLQAIEAATATRAPSPSGPTTNSVFSPAALSPPFSHIANLPTEPTLIGQVTELPSQPPSARSECDYRAVANAWREYIKVQIETARSVFTPSETRITISSDSAANAAQALLDVFMSWSRSAEGFSIGEDNEQIFRHGETSLRNCNPTTVNFGNITVAMYVYDVFIPPFTYQSI